jgi:hypothetical protein
VNDHTAGCWGSCRKLGEWEFKNLHRIAELPRGSKAWYATLKKDAAHEQRKCPACISAKKKI